MQKGTLLISLDFELAWGVFDHVNLAQQQGYFNNTRNAVPQMLELFNAFNVKATWATIGMLFNKNWEEWQSNIPQVLPTYTNNNFNAYTYGNLIKNKGFEDLFFAPDLIQLIAKEGSQEIATHTYSHYYCLENGQTAAQFQADLQQAKKMAAALGITMQSLVFPRNQFNAAYLETCAREGIGSVRSNPATWYWQPKQLNSLAAKIIRTADAYVPFGKKSYQTQSVHKQVPLQQPASRFLRPQGSVALFNTLRFTRIKNEMLTAAKNGEVYHLWWHPHNFGRYPAESLHNLKQLLLVYKQCQEHYGMQSVTMNEFREKIMLSN